MQAFSKFEDMDTSFWAFIKYISETLGYTNRGSGLVKKYSVDKIKKLCSGKYYDPCSTIFRDACGFVKWIC